MVSNYVPRYITYYKRLLYIGTRNSSIHSIDTQNLLEINSYLNICASQASDLIDHIYFDAVGNIIYTCHYDKTTRILLKDGTKTILLRLSHRLLVARIDSKGRFIAAGDKELHLFF